MNKSTILLVNDWWSQLTSTSYSCELFLNKKNLHQEILDYLVANIWSRSIPHSEYGLCCLPQSVLCLDSLNGSQCPLLIEAERIHFCIFKFCTFTVTSSISISNVWKLKNIWFTTIDRKLKKNIYKILSPPPPSPKMNRRRWHSSLKSRQEFMVVLYVVGVFLGERSCLYFCIV
jgi:hypothetical protein